jgi:hypothetical protein
MDLPDQVDHEDQRLGATGRARSEWDTLEAEREQLAQLLVTAAARWWKSLDPAEKSRLLRSDVASGASTIKPPRAGRRQPRPSRSS